MDLVVGATARVENEPPVNAAILLDRGKLFERIYAADPGFEDVA